MDIAEKLAQALREILEATDGYVPNTSKAMWRNARAALAAHERAQPASVPDGWVMVPHEPTWTMIDAGSQFTNRDDWGTQHDGLSAIWNAMLAAAPAKDR